MRYLLCAVAAVCLSIGSGHQAEAGGNVQVLRDQFGRRVIVQDGRSFSGRRVIVRSRGDVFRSRNFGRQRAVIVRDRPVFVRDSRFRSRSRGFGVELFRDSSIFGVRRGFRVGF